LREYNNVLLKALHFELPGRTGRGRPKQRGKNKYRYKRKCIKMTGNEGCMQSGEMVKAIPYKIWPTLSMGKNPDQN